MRKSEFSSCDVKLSALHKSTLIFAIVSNTTRATTSVMVSISMMAIMVCGLDGINELLGSFENIMNNIFQGHEAGKRCRGMFGCRYSMS